MTAATPGNRVHGSQFADTNQSHNNSNNSNTYVEEKVFSAPGSPQLQAISAANALSFGLDLNL
jgi:hypothetical protein